MFFLNHGYDMFYHGKKKILVNMQIFQVKMGGEEAKCEKCWVLGVQLEMYLILDFFLRN